MGTHTHMDTYKGNRKSGQNMVENMEVRPYIFRGWLGGSMVLGKLLVPVHPTIWITVGQGPTALAVGAGGGCLDIFTLICAGPRSAIGRAPDS